MNKTYFEVTIDASDYLDSFENYIFDYGISAIEEENNKLIVRMEENPDELIKELNAYAKELCEIFQESIEVKISFLEKDNADWIETFKQSINPVEVGSFYVRPSWHEPKEDKIDLIIDPALAFGTGHHATTRGMLTLISKYIESSNTLIDVGTGSGVLAIAASKLGAICDACDTDEVATKSALENAIYNNTTINNIWTGSALQAKKEYDVVLANIVADIIILISKDILKACKTDGLIMLSGIVENRLEDVKAKFAMHEIVEIINEEGWVSIAYRKK
jgi:ribosomal protein L11 methyltransferase